MTIRYAPKAGGQILANSETAKVYNINDISVVIRVNANCRHWSNEVRKCTKTINHFTCLLVSALHLMKDIYLKCPAFLAAVCITLHFYYIYYKPECLVMGLCQLIPLEGSK